MKRGDLPKRCAFIIITLALKSNQNSLESPNEHQHTLMRANNNDIHHGTSPLSMLFIIIIYTRVNITCAHYSLVCHHAKRGRQDVYRIDKG